MFSLKSHPKKRFKVGYGVHRAHNLSYWNWATSGEGHLECSSRTYCRRRYQSPLVALPRWPRSGLGHHLRSSHQSHLTQRWWPGLWSQTFQHGQPEVEEKVPVMIHIWTYFYLYHLSLQVEKALRFIHVSIFGISSRPWFVFVLHWKTKHVVWITQKVNHKGAHSVKVRVRVLWHVVVEHNVDSLDVHASAKQVGRNKDPSLEVLKLLVPGQPEGRSSKRNKWDTIPKY